MKNERANIEKIIKIVERADNMGLLFSDRLSLLMDLEFATEQFNLRLDDFVNANDGDFAHDVNGIQSNFNRETKKMENYFVPRFSGK